MPWNASGRGSGPCPIVLPMPALRAQLAERSAVRERQTVGAASLQTSLAAAMARQALALEAKTKAAAELAEFEAALEEEAATAGMYHKAEELLNPPRAQEQSAPAPLEDRPTLGQMWTWLPDSATAGAFRRPASL